MMTNLVSIFEKNKAERRSFGELQIELSSYEDLRVLKVAVDFYASTLSFVDRQVTEGSTHDNSDIIEERNRLRILEDALDAALNQST